MIQQSILLIINTNLLFLLVETIKTPKGFVSIFFPVSRKVCIPHKIDVSPLVLILLQKVYVETLVFRQSFGLLLIKPPKVLLSFSMGIIFFPSENLIWFRIIHKDSVSKVICFVTEGTTIGVTFTFFLTPANCLDYAHSLAA